MTNKKFRIVFILGVRYKLEEIDYRKAQRELQSINKLYFSDCEIGMWVFIIF